MTQLPILVHTLVISTLLIGEKAPKGIFYNGNSESLGILRKEGKP